jgi:hypothetical protein
MVCATLPGGLGFRLAVAGAPVLLVLPGTALLVLLLGQLVLVRRGEAPSHRLLEVAPVFLLALALHGLHGLLARDIGIT